MFHSEPCKYSERYEKILLLHELAFERKTPTLAGTYISTIKKFLRLTFFKLRTKFLKFLLFRVQNQTTNTIRYG